MGGFFATALKEDCIFDLYYGTDYHSHLGTRRAGMAVYGEEGFNRAIHNIENSPFRTKFEGITEEMHGCAAIGCISDTDPQPMMIHSNHGVYAIVIVGVINNDKELMKQYLSFSGGHFEAMSGGRVIPEIMYCDFLG